MLYTILESRVSINRGRLAVGGRAILRGIRIANGSPRENKILIGQATL